MLKSTTFKQLIFLVFALICLQNKAISQLTTPPDGGNLKASVSEQIGLTNIAVNYSRPGVKGREGKIYGTSIAHFGFADQHFGTSKAAPWRAGANENTTISVSNDVKIEGKLLPAGKYGLFMALSENEVTLIFSKNADSWGSFYYEPAEDVLRVNAKQLKDQPIVERLKFEFLDQTESSATLALFWEHWKIPMKIEVDLVNDQLRSFRTDLRTDKGFTHLAFMQAAKYCLDKNINLEEAAFWAEKAISETYIGVSNFGTLSLKARILEKLGRTEEASSLMKKAMALGGVAELHQYGRQLMQAQKLDEAMEVFKLNELKNPTAYAPKVGLARVLSALGKYKEALKYAKLAQPLVPDNEIEKANIAEIIKKLNEGKDVN